MTALKNALAVNDGKAVVISIKREWLAKIMSGEKTLEVRKSRPWEISFPFAENRHAVWLEYLKCPQTFSAHASAAPETRPAIVAIHQPERRRHRKRSCRH